MVNQEAMRRQRSEAKKGGCIEEPVVPVTLLQVSVLFCGIRSENNVSHSTQKMRCETRKSVFYSSGTCSQHKPRDSIYWGELSDTIYFKKIS